MIRAVVWSHVIPARHMALNTLRTGTDLKQNFTLARFYRLTDFTFLLMEMVDRGVVLCGAVTLQTQGITFLYQFDGVHIMTIAALNVMAVHLALDKRTEYVDLLKDLPIGKIEIFIQQAWPVIVQQISACMSVIRHAAPTGMAWRTQRYLLT